MVLPQPEGPNKEKNSPPRIVKLIRAKASTFSKRRTMFSRVTAGMFSDGPEGFSIAESPAWLAPTSTDTQM